MIKEKGKDDFSLADYQSLTPKGQDQAFVRDRAEQNKRGRNRTSGDWIQTLSASGDVKCRVRCRSPWSNELSQSDQLCRSQG